MVATAQNCNLDGNVPAFQNYVPEEDSVLNRITLGHQAIISTFKFSCQEQTCGNITEWGVDVYPTGQAHQGAYTINFQVWRPSPTVDESTGTGCYSLVGNNRFSSISLSGGVAVVTPSPENFIQFRDGDVLGLHVEEARNTFDGVVLLNFGRYSSETVWLGRINPTASSSLSGGCPYTVGSMGDLSSFVNAAPVISVKTGESG